MDWLIVIAQMCLVSGQITDYVMERQAQCQKQLIECYKKNTELSMKKPLFSDDMILADCVVIRADKALQGK